MRTANIDDVPEHLTGVQPEVYQERQHRAHAPASEFAALCLDILRDGGYVGLQAMLAKLGKISANKAALRYTLIAMAGDQSVRNASYSERGTKEWRSKQAEHQALDDACAFIARVDPDTASRVREFFAPPSKQ